jgi:hypothetical protein
MYNPNFREHYKDQLLQVVSYYMDSEMRRHFMRECPAAYNALCGRTVVTSQVEDTDSKVIARVENND